MNISERIRYLRKEVLCLTQEALGEPLGLSRANIANIEAGRIAVTERVILGICEKHGVNKEWLEDGTGPIIKPITRSEKIAKFAGNLMKEENDSFKKRLVEALADLDESDWEVLEKLALSIKKD